jgi:hypothetical protein
MPMNIIIVHFLPNFSLSTIHILIKTAGMVAIEININDNRIVVFSSDPYVIGISTSSPYTTKTAEHHIIDNFQVTLKCWSSNMTLSFPNPIDYSC